ncbi:hypothetical protein I5770_01100 [Brucella sp. BO2]|uniref:hypothetical protein n=1 Tax=Brucella TaxID=234 RepID=UPI00046CB29B|nr:MULTISPECIES: hypothetical protein [Brucella]KEY05889.1 hypothetical protein IL59_0201000 [Brucella suis bv. 4 str. 40]QPN27285.1 hypothetical protein I5770_01100 [Brucella sp. BO2]
MEYTAEVLNRTTGDLETTSLGNWITITELGKKYGTGPRQTRTVLKQMGILETRYTGSSHIHRQSLTDQAVQNGLGKHLIPKKKGQTPFDVLSPKGQQWIADRWAEAVTALDKAKTDDARLNRVVSRLEAFKAKRKMPLTPQMEVCWLIDHYPDVSQTDMGVILSLPKQTISHWVKLRAKQRNAAKLRQSQSLS